MTDDIIRSMKRQMNPSDDTVADLLSKISALEASPETANAPDSFEAYVSTFDAAASKKPSTQTKKLKTKSIWFYGTAAAASVIVLLSAFSLIGGTDANNIQNNLNNIIDNPSVAFNEGSIKENLSARASNDDSDDISADSAEEEQSEKKGLGSLISNLFKKDKNSDKDLNSADEKVKDNDKSQDSENSNPNLGDETQTPEIPDSDKLNPEPLPPPANNGIGDDDSSKITPGAPGEDDINWSREILADTGISNLVISGTNYVIETVASSTVASSEVKTISLEIPATQTTNHTMVKARVKRVKHVSKDLMIAVDANGFKDTLLYTNKDYRPETLEQYISDSGLSSNTSFAKAVYCKGDNIGYSSYQRINVDNIGELINGLIFSCSNASLADYESYRSGNVHVLFKSTVNPTCSVIDFGVSDNGYLYVKMASGNSFTFHIDATNAQSFISSITGM